MIHKDVIWAVLSGMECKPVMKSKLLDTLQTMLGTKNEFEEGDATDKWDNSRDRPLSQATNREAHSSLAA